MGTRFLPLLDFWKKLYLDIFLGVNSSSFRMTAFSSYKAERTNKKTNLSQASVCSFFPIAPNFEIVSASCSLIEIKSLERRRQNALGRGYFVLGHSRPQY